MVAGVLQGPQRRGTDWGGEAYLVKVKVSMTIDKEVFASFKNFCKQNGMKVSTRVEQMMKENIKNSTLQQFIRLS